MKSLVQFIKECLINEGGKAVTANPIPAYITPLLYKIFRPLVEFEKVSKK